MPAYLLAFRGLISYWLLILLQVKAAGRCERSPGWVKCSVMEHSDEQHDTRTVPSGKRPCNVCGNYHSENLDCQADLAASSQMGADPIRASEPANAQSEPDFADSPRGNSSDSGSGGAGGANGGSGQGVRFISSQLVSGSGQGRSGRAPDPLIGKTIGGKYQIISQLGKGGMSRVYKAQQLPINRIVAIKMLLGHLAEDEESVKRFLLEAQATGQISHSNVVNIFDYGIAEDQQPYLVMDYIEGETLSQILKEKKRLSVAEAIPLFAEICDGLGAAHDHGIIHRDIKPSNIVLQNTSSGRRARVVDFGIAKMLDSENQHLTKTGEVFGSPYYMSPEQCEGLEIDKRSDIYSLGLVLYETLTGTLPLTGKTAIETMTLHMQALPPSLRKSAGEDAQIPLALENVVFKMLERNREKRYGNMLEVRTDLLHVAAGEKQAISGNISYVRRELSRKSKILLVVLAAVAALALLIVLSLPHILLALSQQCFDRAVESFKDGNNEQSEQSLCQAVDYSRQAGNSAAESRNLELLVRVYRVEGKTALVAETRKRRRELIKAAMSGFDINNESLDNIISQASKASESDVMLASNLVAPVGIAEPSLNSSVPDSNSSAMHAARQNSSAAPAPTPHLPSAATASPHRYSAAAPASAITPVPIPAEAPAAGAGEGGAAGVTPGSAAAGQSVDSSSHEPLSNSKPAAVAFNNSNRERENSKADRLVDSLQALVEMCLEKGSFSKAKTCADKALQVYEQERLPQDNELAKIYTARAWSNLQLGAKSDALTDVRQAMDLSEKANALPEQAEAEGVQSVIYLQSGNKQAAKECYGRVCRMIANGLHPKPILSDALRKYNQETAKK